MSNNSRLENEFTRNIFRWIDSVLMIRGGIVGYLLEQRTLMDSITTDFVELLQ